MKNKPDIHVDETSVWLSATPTAYTRQLPFHITEAGCFYAGQDYRIERDFHDSFLLLYTICGSGVVKSSDTSLILPENHLFLLNCHTPHAYYTQEDKWDFLWFHINGSSVQTFYDTMYPSEKSAFLPDNPILLESRLRTLLELTEQTSLNSVLQMSCILHEVLNTCIFSALQTEQILQKRSYTEDIARALAFIETSFSSQITIDDIIADIPISKYHFIRIFKRTMGVTPYHYVNLCRINYAKKLLRTTNLSVSDIAEQCGFLDTSNFIYRFQKLAGQRPTAYRKAFTAEEL